MSISKFYCAQSTKPGGSLRWGDLESEPRKHGYASELEDPITKEIHVINETQFGDYGGSTVEQSNHRVMLADKKCARYLVQLTGDYSSQALAYIPKKNGEAPKPVAEYLEGLRNHPLVSDDDHTELETELEIEAWESDGRDDFCKALTTYLDEQDTPYEHDLDLIAGEGFDDRIFELWRAGVEAFNVNGGSGCEHEHGGSVYFYIEKWFEEATRRDPNASDWSKNARANLGETINQIARETGFDSDAMRGALSVARDADLLGDHERAEGLRKQARRESEDLRLGDDTPESAVA